MALLRLAVLVLVVVSGGACNPVGASCVSRQKTGSVASLSGTAGAGQTVVHRVAYGTSGSQNNIDVSWTNQGQPGGPQLQFYVTRTSCEDFVPATTSGSCQILGRGGWFDGHVASTVIIANGRGNPDVLGTPAEYKLWVVGDPQQGATYSISASWFYGPDC